MAIIPADVSKLAEEASCRQKNQQKQAELNRSLEIISPSRIKAFEEEIDQEILATYKVRRLWNIIKKIGIAEVCLSNSASQTLWELKRRGLLDNFLDKYRIIGWTVKLKSRSVSTDSFETCLFFTKRLEQTKREIPRLPDILEKKRRRCAKLLTELSEVEAEIQFLTESPNSRDPLLLPRTAGK